MRKLLKSLAFLLLALLGSLSSQALACSAVDAEPILAPADVIFMGRLTGYEVESSLSGEPIRAVLTYEVERSLKGEVAGLVHMTWDGAPWGEGIPSQIQAPATEIVGGRIIPGDAAQLASFNLFVHPCGDRYVVAANAGNLAAIQHWIETGEASDHQLNGDGTHWRTIEARYSRQTDWLYLIAAIAALALAGGVFAAYRRD